MSNELRSPSSVVVEECSRALVVEMEGMGAACIEGMEAMEPPSR